MSENDPLLPTPGKDDIKPEDLKSWLPVDAIIENGRPAIEWMNVGDVQFNEPFFLETLARVDQSRKVVTDFDLLLQLEKISESLSPTGFIFHSSRCGSTLLANVCRAIHGSIVIAEAPVIDKIASRLFTDAEPNSPKELLYMLFLKGAVNALGQRRTGDERHYFVKFACTTTLQMSRIRRIWPRVPFVFLYRNPVEVIVSNLKAVPQWMKPDSNTAAAAAIVGVDVQELNRISPEEFCARALGRFLAVADANRTAQTRLIDYDQLNLEMLMKAVEFFGITLTPVDISAIRRASRLYSKDSTRSRMFQPDGELKIASASPNILEMAEKWALPSYERLNLRQ